MKSFGTVAIMNRLGIPIPTENNKRSSEARIDFFHNVLVEMGDNQNVMNGESTYIAQLNSLSKIISKVYPSNEQCCESSNYHLILLDEVGDGTDPDAGSCIAQAILEKILESSYTRTICTTHSSRLKALSITDNRFKSASVLLQSGNHDAKNRLPTYKLSYDTIGQSNALSAVMRTNPKLPEDLIKRASNLISSSNDERGEEIRTIMEALEREKELAHYATEAANAHQSEMKRCRDALVLVAKAYDQQLSRVEDRLDSNFALLKTDDSKDSYDLVGDSITTLRLVRKKIKTLEDTLKEKGMRMVMDRDQFKGGESVTIIQEGDYVGENAIVHYNQEESHSDEVIVEIEKSFDWIGTDQKILDTNIDYRKLKFKRHELAVWDYPDYSEDGWEGQNYDQVKSIPDSRSRLIETLNSFKGSLPEKKVSSSKENDGKQFTSSRQRKAASKSTKKQKKKKK
jgi:DNA mismatch repair protein MutS2